MKQYRKILLYSRPKILFNMENFKFIIAT